MAAASASSSLRRAASSFAATDSRCNEASSHRWYADCRSLGIGSDELFVTLASKHDLAFISHAANDLQNFLLLVFHVGYAYGAFRLEVVAQHLGRALRHILEDLFTQGLGGALECHDQRLRLDFAQQRLDATIV